MIENLAALLCYVEVAEQLTVFLKDEVCKMPDGIESTGAVTCKTGDTNFEIS